MVTGTLINVGTVIVGGSLGTLLGNRLPEKTRQTVLSGLGLMTLVIGVTMAIQTQNTLIPLFSVLIGGILGEALRIEYWLERFGMWLQARFGRAPVLVPAAFYPAPAVIRAKAQTAPQKRSRTGRRRNTPCCPSLLPVRRS